MLQNEGQPLFSIILTGRNDNYGGLFKKRLELCVNYFAHSMNQTGNTIAYEIIIVDWDSETHLAAVLNLTLEAASKIRFINVSHAIAEKYNPNGRNFNTTVALNAGILRARGKYIIHMPADILFTTYSLAPLCNVLTENIPLHFDPQKSIMLVKRHIIPSSFHETEKSFAELDRYLSLSTNWLEYNRIHPGISADFGALICSAEVFMNAGGFDENLTGWGKNDSRLGFTANKEYPVYELSGLGIICYDPTVDSVNINLKLKTANQAQDIITACNTKNIGLTGYELEEESGKATDITQTAYKATKKPDSDLSATALTRTIARHLPFNAVSICPELYPLCWFLQNFRVDTFCDFISGSAKRSGRLTEIMLESDATAALVSSINPAAEIISVLPQKQEHPETTDHTVIGRQYLNKKGGKLSFFRTLLNELFPEEHLVHKWHPGFAASTHHGPVHYITGNPDTATARIRERFFPTLRADLIVFRADEVTDAEAVLKEVLQFAAASSLTIIINPEGIVLDKAAKDLTDKLVIPDVEHGNIALIIKGDPQTLNHCDTKKMSAAAQTWKRHFIAVNYIKSLIFSGLIYLKKKFG